MIAPQTRFRLAHVPLRLIEVTEYQRRYFDRVAHYVALLEAPEHADADVGIIALRPLSNGRYELLDGHHRYVASIIAGRATLLALIHYCPTDAGYEDAQAPECLAHRHNEQDV